MVETCEDVAVGNVGVSIEKNPGSHDFFRKLPVSCGFFPIFYLSTAIICDEKFSVLVQKKQDFNLRISKDTLSRKQIISIDPSDTTHPKEALG